MTHEQFQELKQLLIANTTRLGTLERQFGEFRGEFAEFRKEVNSKFAGVSQLLLHMDRDITDIKKDLGKG